MSTKKEEPAHCKGSARVVGVMEESIDTTHCGRRDFNSEAGPSGGLQRVLPMSLEYVYQRRLIDSHLIRSEPSDRGHSQENILCNQRDEKRVRLATEKVLRWRTATPEPLESSPAVEQVEEGSPSPKDFEFDTCNCVALVSTDRVGVDMRKPDFANTDDQEEAEIAQIVELLARSPTLYFLRDGYRNYVVNDISEKVHRLSAYSCHSACFKVYNAYKSISCRPERPNVAVRGSVGEQPEQPLQSESYMMKMMATINQYLNVFSTLADFNYTSMTPALKVGVCNAMVVDKVWTYNQRRQIHLPHYQLLTEDGYTDMVVNEIRKLENRGVRINNIRFLSTPNTVLYTNQRTLSRRDHTSDEERKRCADQKRAESKEKEDTQKRRHEESIDSATEDDDLSAPLPFKKRNFTKPDEKPEMSEILNKSANSPRHAELCYSSTIPSSPNEYVLRTRGWRNVGHQPGCTRSDKLETSATPSVGISVGKWRDRPDYEIKRKLVKNPTLVVFKQSLDEREPETLLCNIVTEMHLGDEIRY